MSMLNRWRMCLSIYDHEMPIMVFPVLVTTFFSLGLICNISIPTASWWMGCASTILIIWLREKYDALKCFNSILSFLAFLAFVWIFAHVTVTQSWLDDKVYHQPAIRMLSEGWNPVWQGTPAAISQASGLPTDHMSILHILAMPRGVWYFCTALYRFTGAHLNLFLSVYPFLVLMLWFSLYHAFPSVSRYVRLSALIVAFWLFPEHPHMIDTLIAVAGIGLILAMYEYLKTGLLRVLPLLCFSFWMVIAKQTSALHCAIFWLVFISFCALDKKLFPIFVRLAQVGVLTFLLFWVVNASPYITNWMNFGNPFYPRFSGNESMHPTVDITGDLKLGNADAKNMDHFGTYCYVYLSSDLVTSIYRRFGDEKFTPERPYWKDWTGAPDIEHTVLFILPLLLLAFGTKPMRFLSLSFFIASIAMPKELLYVVRYIPWGSACGILLWLALPMMRVSRISYCPVMVYKYLYGRDGQSVSQYRDNNWMLVRMLNRVLDVLENPQNISEERVAYLQHVVYHVAKTLYFNFFFVCPPDQLHKDLPSIDERLKVLMPLFYDAFDKHAIPRRGMVKLHYIRDWRRHHYLAKIEMPILRFYIKHAASIGKVLNFVSRQKIMAKC